MPLFQYTAKKGPGEYLAGEMEAESVAVVRVRLREDGLFALQIEEAGADAAGAMGGFRFGRKVRADDLAMFARQLGNLTAAGLPVLSGLDVLAEQSENRHVRRAVLRLADHLRHGATLADAMRRQPDVFPSAFAAALHAGETGGTLDAVLSTLADHFETESELWSGVKTALIYPCFLAFAGAATVFVLLSFVIPHFMSLFREFGTELPWPTQVLLAVSGFMSRGWWSVPIAAIAVVACVRIYQRTPEGGLALDALRLRAPLLGKLTHKAEMAKFARTLGMLLKSGVSAVDAIDISGGTLANRAIAAQVDSIKEDVRQGKRMADAFSAARYFPLMLTNLVAVGERTGDLAGVFGKAADIYERDVRRYSRVMSKMLEPVMIVLVGGVVGFIVIATLLPVFRISTMVH